MRVPALMLLLAGCVPAQVAEPDAGVVTPDPDPGYPPKMGDVTGQLGGTAVAWETFDFSIGAFDASAWVDHFDGPYRLHLYGHTPGDPRSDADLLRVTGSFAGGPAKGALRAVEITIGEDAGWTAQSPTMVVERIDAPGGSGYGSASGRITASLCPANPAIKAPCRLFDARFATRVQFNG